MKKNDIINLKITDMSKDGLGVAKLDRLVYFVKNGIIGDEVEAIVTKIIKDKYAYAKVEKIISKSPFRIDPICDNANRCGGCSIMNLSYDKQIELKMNIVKNDLMHVGGFDENEINKIYDGIIKMDNPYYYRNKLQIPFSYDKNNKIVCGFYALNTHYIIDTKTCEIIFKNSFDIINFIKEYLEKENFPIYDEMNNTGIFREVMIRKANNTSDISVTFIINDKNYKRKYYDFYKKIASKLSNRFNNIKTITLNINTKKTNIIFGDENIILYGDGYIEDIINNIKYHISPESFYQINNIMTEKLYNTIIEYGDFKKDESVLDLYCGIGTITLQVAKYVKNIKGIEIVEKAIENAKDNMKINNINNASFEIGDAGKIDNMISDFDTIILDPPRKGIDNKTIDYIIKSKINKIIYVSCDPATLSRDLKLLKICYNIEKIKSVDMFPHTMHTENVVLLTRSK